MSRRITAYLITVLALIFVFGTGASAEQVRTEAALRNVGSEDGLNRYENTMGTGFETNLTDQETDAYFAIFSFDSTVSWQFERDGTEIAYENEDILVDTGDYVLTVTYSDMPQLYSTFRFRIVESDFSDMGSVTFGDVIEDPRMTVTFDEEKQMFCYRLPNGAGFYASVPYGGIAAMSARFEFSEEYSVTVQRNGMTETYDETVGFTQAGAYQLRIVRLNQYDSNQTDYNSYIINFPFVLINSSVSSLTVINAPDDFVIWEIYMNGEPVERDSPYWQWLDADGIYECIFTGEENQSLFYSISFRKDTSAPFLNFSEGAFSGEASIVQYTPVEENCTIAVTRNSEYYTPAANTLAVAGNYRITVSDQAGNVRTYDLKIQDDIRLFDIRMIILLAVVLAGAAVYLIYLRTHMRVL